MMLIVFSERPAGYCLVNAAEPLLFFCLVNTAEPLLFSV